MRRDLGSSPGIRDGLLLLATCCCCSVTRLYMTLYNPRDCSMPGFPVLHHRHLTKLMSSESVIPSNHLILCWPLLLRLQSFPTSGSLLMSRLFASGDQSIGASDSTSVLPVNIQSWFPLGLISLQCKGLSRVFSSTVAWKHQFFVAQPSLWSNSHIVTCWEFI